MGTGLGSSIILSSPHPHPLSSSPHLSRPFLPLLRLRSHPPPPLISLSLSLSPRLDRFISKCCVTNVDVQLDAVTVTCQNDELNNIPSLQSGCPIPLVAITGDDLDLDLPTPPFGLLPAGRNSVFEELPVLSAGEQQSLAATPAHPKGLYAMYACYLFGNLVEQLWNFAWPAALSILHPSLLPVAVVGFFTKFSVFVGAPIVGKLMDHFPRIPTYNGLNVIQVATQLISAGMIIHGFNTIRPNSPPAVLLQPWFIVLVMASAIERIAGLALGVTMERDWVVLLAGSNRPVALAQANAILNRLDLLCETLGASVFGILLSKFSTVTCLKVACGLMVGSLPVLIILGQIMNRLSCYVLDCHRTTYEKASFGDLLLNSVKLVHNSLDAITHGWNEYKHQTVLPASVASVLLFFNVALAPGAIMTALLMHYGISPSIIGVFSGLCSTMGLVATFTSAGLVKRLGILKVLSRLGHMSYDVVGTQILQTGIPASKANLIGATEVSIASLAELVMLGGAIILNDVSHFGVLAILSAAAVACAALMFCRWLANPTDEQRELFTFDPHFTPL
ncbi:solute carrier family 40 member 2 [Carex littledalei]|uniref:Solute carrier family 40 member n=1 Tax=Carex littledalei TaxID=544730 RepID=A0A833QVY1_9POAL|nr:solute carrier family 40 member 2 [Carex littledalei]